MELIDKAAVVAEIERRLDGHKDEYKHSGDIYASVLIEEVEDILFFLNTLEVKDVDWEKEIKSFTEHRKENKMDYKDKYEQALERARTFSQRWQGIEATDSEPALRELKEIFPELKESEDERKKKEIIAYLESVLLHKEHRDKTIEGWISWLKTQGEHANFRNKIQIGDEVTRNEDGALVNLSQFKRIVKQGEQKPTDKVEPKFKVGDCIRHKGSDECYRIVTIDNKYYFCENGHAWAIRSQDYFELVEQKHTNNVEPKFKVGDWIINSEGMLRHIVDVDKTGYQTDNGWLTHDSYEREFHLWTIQDAKDGDVLVFDDAFILIFKEITDLKLNPPLFKKVRGFYFKSYINLDFLMNVFEQGTFCYDIGSSCHPATKEQRDLLFQKMKEAGYEWDDEKKELKKIEQKSKEKTKFYDSMDDLIADALIEEIENSDLDDSSKHNRIFWIKSHRHNPTWSEEDEEMFDAIIADIQFTQKAHTHEVNQVVYEREIDWFKSLKEKYTWKPSDEQMNLLEYLVEDNNQRYFYNILRSLYEQLKKLREE